MTGNLLGVSVSGLRVAQSNLSVTGHNIANANVEGYSRQRANAETNPAVLLGAGYVGTGASINSIERITNQFITEQVRIDTSLFNDLETFTNNISQLDRLLSDPQSGLANSLGSFFAAMQNAADDPTSIPARQLVLSEATNLADKFNTLHERFDVIAKGIDESLTSSVADINALTSTIAKLNQRIGDASGAGEGASPNDLLDQRDEAIRKLSEIVAIQTYDEGFGQVNVILPSGQNLVVGIESRQLAISTSADDASRKDIVIKNGANDIVVSDLISGGKLGGLLRFQNNSLSQSYNGLGRIAIAMSDTFNTMHNGGIDLYNQFGGDIFYDINAPEISRERVVGNSDNAQPDDRLLSLNIVDSSRITADDYELKIESGGLLRITNLSSGQEVARSVLNGSLPQTLEFDGLSLEFEQGSFQAGDSFKLAPTRSAARDFSAELKDPRSLAFGSPLVTDASIGNTGSGSISAGQVTALEDAFGNPLPLFANSGQMSPPLIVKFTSATTYDILDNSDPGRPVDLSPPMRNQRYTPGISNNVFPTDAGETLVRTRGDLIGLPSDRTPVIGGGAFNNRYPSEAFTISRAPELAGLAPESVNVFSAINASAKQTASLLNNVEGVSAQATTYAEISDISSLNRSEPLQINLNGEDLIEYEFDAGSGTFILSPAVPDPASDEDAFNDYLASRINANDNLSALGIFARVGRDAVSGAPELRLTATEGDDINVVLEANAGESLNIGDGTNTPIALTGNGVGITSAIAVGGSIDVRLAEGISLSSFPQDSLLFGDTGAADFAQSNYLGIQASIQGSPQAGDTFTFNFNNNAASDNRNALALAQLQGSAKINGSSLSFGGAYSSLVEKIGIDTASSKNNRDASEKVLQEVTSLRDSVSAVNLDEEAANLIKYEQMFSANAQVISVARELFDRLINSL